MGTLLLLCCLACASSDSPPDIDDLLRLPPLETVRELLDFNAAYREHVEAGLQLHPGDADLMATRTETIQLGALWELLLRAHGIDEEYPEYISLSEEERREALAELRERIGPAAYYSGQLPPHVPTWRFRRLD